MVATSMSGQTLLNGDLNHDGVIDIADVTALVNVVVGRSQAEVINIVVPDTYEYVNLGLPSGTLWATCNIGAASPEECGDYFAWGETVPYGGEDLSNAHNYATTGSYVKTKYEWSTYKYCSGSDNTITKYCNKSSHGNNGFTDTLTELLSEDDAATANWGRDWCMPNWNQINELRSNCTWTWSTRNGMDGYEVKGPNGNSIFLPAAGGMVPYLGRVDTGNDGCYWSCTLYTDNPNLGWCILFGRTHNYFNNSLRYYGRPIHPVRNK